MLIPISATPWKTIQTKIEDGYEWHCPECGWRKRWTKAEGLVSIVAGNPLHAHRSFTTANGNRKPQKTKKRPRHDVLIQQKTIKAPAPGGMDF